MLLKWCSRRFVCGQSIRNIKVQARVVGNVKSSANVSRNEFCTYPRLCAEVTPLRKQLKDASKAARSTKISQGSNEEHTAKDESTSAWELTVGIEIHAQLHTGYKLFSDSRTDYGEEPNTHLQPFDIAFPGSLPLFQPPVLIPALRAALALNCQIQPVSKFDRKHYFYHDQPAGYQVTQYYAPFAKDGLVSVNANDGLPSSQGDELLVGIKQVQLEQDTARTQEQDEETNLIDFNRSGHPLIEIISLPHIHSPEAAAAYMRKIQGLLYAVDAVTTGMELGGLRADVNVSVRRRGAAPGRHSYSGVTGLGQRTEIKNLSSFKAVEDAVRAERDRQISILEAGGIIEGETRGWSLSSPGQTRRLRGKEGEVDYRYMPDPDIPPLRIGQDLVRHLQSTLPPVPDHLLVMLEQNYGLSNADAKSLLSLEDGRRLIYFQEVVDLLKTRSGGSNAAQVEEFKRNRSAANWILHELGALLTSTGKAWHQDLVPASAMADIVRLHLENQVTGPSAKRLLRTVFDGDRTAVKTIAERENLLFVELDNNVYASLIRKIVDESPDVVDDIVNKGKHAKIKFLLGQLMKGKERNQIDPKKAEQLIRQKLGINEA